MEQDRRMAGAGPNETNKGSYRWAGLGVARSHTSPGPVLVRVGIHCLSMAKHQHLEGLVRLLDPTKKWPQWTVR